ncbi:prolyl oligopeptidase family serine peptidase [Parasphingorhabdus halotolerans]|uniref:prolyl oligopeptidase n=1 Tax=Parasphingorhabdus halotolerans TaxID=2725558 RepID=A0A6H2DLX4_9SPHN|nr:prolyl oligopeptidase family serine peptidase [Parasphingorhabdus halotolerans]QJB69198.1 S9 family peptidase [Parasphingorhabdus halotolerans]
MRKSIFHLLILAPLSGLLAVPALAQIETPAPGNLVTEETILAYPETKTVDVVDELFGEYISDPYRWLENDVRENEDVAAWVKAQNAVTNSYLETIEGREVLAASMTKLFDYDALSAPTEAGGKFFYERKSGGQNQAVLYVREGKDGKERVLIDPASWSADGATALAEWKPSGDGKFLVYAIQDGGSDWRTLKVIDVEKGEVLTDTVEWAKFTNLAWMPKNTGFLYSRFPKPKEGGTFQSLNKNQAIYLHPLGADQSKDYKVYDTPDRPELNHSAELTSDKEWIIITSSSGTDDRYEMTLIKVDAPEIKRQTLVEGFDYSWSLIDGIGDTLYFTTNKDASRLRVVKTDVSKLESRDVMCDGPDAETTICGKDVFVFSEVVPEHSATIDSAAIVGDKLYVDFIDDAKSRVEVFALDGTPVGLIDLPGLGTVSELNGSAKTATGYFAFGSFNRPTTIYSFSDAGKSAIWAKPDFPFDPDTIEVKQQFYQSKDGTKIPMFVVHKKDLDLSEGAPTLLYGYGGFNISVLPQYKPAWMAWIEAGGVFASANLRGGGEYGKAWHDGGRLQNKQNVFDDFIAAGEYLIAEGVTPENGLAIEGRSNGGLLVGAVMNQRPDLFAAGHAAVGVMDMLRFDRFTAGRYWVDDYGYPDKEQDFKTLLSYSPYHNIKSGTEYPALMVTTADTDDRVVPGHSFKYTARLQALDTGDKPHLIRIETRAGHGSGKPTDKLIEEYADIYAFLAKATGLDVVK